jgi:hypothetical protein
MELIRRPAVWDVAGTVRYAVQASSGVWRSLVARFVRDEEAVGSNPATPTFRNKSLTSSNTVSSLPRHRTLACASIRSVVTTFGCEPSTATG